MLSMTSQHECAEVVKPQKKIARIIITMMINVKSMAVDDLVNWINFSLKFFMTTMLL